MQLEGAQRRAKEGKEVPQEMPALERSDSEATEATDAESCSARSGASVGSEDAALGSSGAAGEGAQRRRENKGPHVLDHKDVSLVWDADQHAAEGYEGPRKVFVGTARVSRFRKALDKFEINTVVNCTMDAPCKFEKDDKFRYLHVEIADDDEQDVLLQLPHATSFIQLMHRGGNVLIHCTQGVSRSVTVFIAWLIEHQGYFLRHALSFVKQQRAIAKPNSGFLKQLIEFERQHRPEPSMSLEDLDPCPVCLKAHRRWGTFACGHRCCDECLQRMSADEVCAHCEYEDGNASARARAGSLEDLSTWRDKMAPCVGKVKLEVDGC